MMKYSLNRQGFTFLECLLTIVLISPIILGLLSMLWFMSNSSEKMQDQAEFQYFSRAILHTILDDVKQADSLSVNQDKSKLSLVFPGDVIVEYYCQGGSVYRHGSNKLPLAENIGNLTFEMLGDSWVEITVKSSGDNSYQVKTGCAAWSSRW